MSGKIRYRVYGVIDSSIDEAEEVLSEMRQYGSADVVDIDVERVGNGELPDAKEDFEAFVARKRTIIQGAPGDILLGMSVRQVLEAAAPSLLRSLKRVGLAPGGNIIEVEKDKQ